MSSGLVRKLAASIVGAIVVLLTLGFMFDFERASSQGSSTAGPGIWTQLNVAGMGDSTRVYVVRRSGALVLAGTQNQGLFRSQDSGAIWQQVPQYTTAYVRDLWLGGSNGQTALAATAGSGLLRSTNAGARVRWVYNGQTGQGQSNPVSNPANSKQLYLPLILRH